ncbi:MAG: PEP-CTERM sorting domain-containing protein [Planctomycetota bacterium]
MNYRTIFIIATTCLFTSSLAASQSISLSGNDHTGYLSLSGVNNEGVEPESGLPGSKNLGMPFFFDTNQGTAGLWNYIVAVPLSGDSVYAEESTPGVTAGGKGINHAQFSSTTFGSIDYDNSSLTGIGTETISLNTSNVNLDLAAFGPLNQVYGATNPNNEFAWDYVIETQAISSSGLELTFTGGQLTSIDGGLDVGIAVRFLGNDALKFLELNAPTSPGPVATYDGSLDFVGDQFVFDVDITQDVSSALGDLANTRLVFNRSGSISAVPEPTSLLLTLAGAIGVVSRRRRVL